MRKKISVVGGINIDIGGKSLCKATLCDSNPGCTFRSMGGVGRNIAHNIKLLGNDVRIFSAVGNDQAGREAIESCNDIGMDISNVIVMSDCNTSTYLYILDNSGEMLAAISDMEIYERLVPEQFFSKMDIINDSDLIIIDTNIPEKVIAYIAENSTVPVFADPVSCTKAKRLLSSLEFIDTVTPNIFEAEVLADQKIDPLSVESLKDAAGVICDKGANRVVITLGGRGAFYFDRNGYGILPCVPSKRINETGAGDSLMAGYATAIVKGFSFKEALIYGMSAAAITVETSEAISKMLSWKSVEIRKETYINGAEQISGCFT